MHQYYQFDFFETVTRQLQEGLDALAPTLLDMGALTSLLASQGQHRTTQGVYLIFYEGKPMYAGKADDLADRLGQHWRKLSGRQGIDLTKVGYKALLLDRSMSTAANETLLIAMYSERGGCEWNGKGFGPNDPGQRRDEQVPNWFDLAFPIRRNIHVEGIEDAETMGSLLQKLKDALPYLVRWDKKHLAPDEKALSIDLTNEGRTGEALLIKACQTLGSGWQAIALNYGLILYKNGKQYEFGERLWPLAE